MILHSNRERAAAVANSVMRDADFLNLCSQFFNDGTERTVESRKAFFDGLFGPDISDMHTNSSLLKVITKNS